MRTITRILLAMVLAFIPVAAQDANTREAKAVPPSAPNGASSAVADEKAYEIGPEDVLNVNVWKETELSGVVPVRPDGKISVPLIGDVQAAGLTPHELATMITEKLKLYVTEPRVTVIVTATNSQRVYVTGQVLRAGAFPLIPGMTVLQALSSAGGLGQFANGKKTYVLRVAGGQQVRLPFNYSAVLKGEKPEQNIILKPGDTIVVP